MGRSWRHGSRGCVRPVRKPGPAGHPRNCSLAVDGAHNGRWHAGLDSHQCRTDHNTAYCAVIGGGRWDSGISPFDNHSCPFDDVAACAGPGPCPRAHEGELAIATGSVSGPLAYRSIALGSSVDLVITDPHVYTTAVGICRDELERIDALASRFRPDSEIVRLGLNGGRPMQVSEGLYEALTVALGAAAETDGAVDPTVGNALCRLGYDRDFSYVTGGVTGELPAAQEVPGWRSVEIDERRRVVRVPSGMCLDLGATAKALAADRIAREVHRSCGCGVVVSLGGDVAAAGEPPAGGFRIGIEDAGPCVEPPLVVAVQSGGMATSGVTGRRWRLGDQEVHHLVDPSSGLPVRSPWRTVTVSASSCVDANVASTASMVIGAGAVDWLGSRGLHGRLVASDGTVSLAGGWPTDESSPTAEVSVRC
jgi:thiamine biosynthesis lipoprotein ApbE